MTLNRRKIRYLLFRLKSELELGVDPPVLPENFKESFEGQPKFRGWMSFGVTWDVDSNDPWKIILRKKSLEQEWNEVLLRSVPVLPYDLKQRHPKAEIGDTDGTEIIV